MLFLLGLGSGVAAVQAIVTVFTDQFPYLKERRSWVSISVCVVSFGTGLVLCTDSGSLLRLLFDNYGVGRATFLYAVFEVVGVVWIYGWKNIVEDVEFMLEARISWYWKITWRVLSPLSLIAIFVYGSIKEEPSADLPPIGFIIGWVLAAIAVGQIGIWMAVTFVKAPGRTLAQKFRATFAASENFGPRDLDIRKKWRRWKAEKKYYSSIYSTPSSGVVNGAYHEDKL
uniref:Sodium-dependent nutrient amino acid transporter 1 n=1 Tax=Amblyomma triste TaxID=251400 RepID=A0A023GDK3_AMBTT